MRKLITHFPRRGGGGLVLDCIILKLHNYLNSMATMKQGEIRASYIFYCRLPKAEKTLNLEDSVLSVRDPRTLSRMVSELSPKVLTIKVNKQVEQWSINIDV